MPFTVESLQSPEVGRMIDQPSQFNLPSKDFIGYDPKGTTSITGSPLVTRTEEKPAPTEPAEAPVPKVPEEESVTLSPKVSAIARKEQALRQKEKSIAEKEKELSEKLAKAEKYEQLKAKIAAKDYSALDEEGVAYEEYVKHELNKEASKNPETERVRKLEEELANLKKAQEEQVVREYETNQALWKKEIAKVVSENSEFATIKKKKAEDLVLQLINDSFEEDNIELSVEEAAKEVEDHLIAKAKEWASILEPENKVEAGKVLGPPKTAVKTITQNMAPTSKEAKPKPFHLMSEAEQIEEARRRVLAARQQR